MSNEKTYITADGQEFESKNYAKLHANSLSNKSIIVKSEGQTQGQEQGSVADALLTKAQDIIALVTESEDLELIAKYKAAEEAKAKPRVSVLDTIAARTEDLTKEA